VQAAFRHEFMNAAVQSSSFEIVRLHGQILGNNAVNDGVGVYWCFYSGGSFEEIPVSSFVSFA